MSQTNRKFGSANEVVRARRSNAFWMMALFLLFVFLLGGSGRSDVASLPMLRGGSVLFAFWAACGLSVADWRRIRVPLALLLGLAIWMALQLLPLPPRLWHSLPGREIIVQIDNLLGLEGLWRPLSLSPSQTLNSLLAMTVLFAGLLLSSRVPADEYCDLIFCVLAIAAFSALLGIVQLLSGATGGMYLYRITNQGEMVGVFANRNHHAIFLACSILLVGLLLRDESMRRRKRTFVRVGLIFAGFLLTAMTIFIGSRAGIVVGITAFTTAYFVTMRSWRLTSSASSGESVESASVSPSLYRRLLLFAPPLLLIALLGVAFGLTSRTTALSRLLEKDVVDDLRVHAWPTVRAMVDTYWAWGSGFGSFPDVYRIFEPDNLLRPTYFNHAHNDWVESLITGGAPFALMVFVTIAWLIRSFATHGLRNLIRGHRGDLRLAVIATLFVLAGASFVDYPLRVPSLQILAIMLITFACCPKSSKSHGNRP